MNFGSICQSKASALLVQQLSHNRKRSFLPCPQRLDLFHTSSVKYNDDGSAENQTSQGLSTILRRLRGVDTAALCDADKSIRQQEHSSKHNYEGLSLMDPSIKLMTKSTISATRLIGVARTIQCTQPNDFLAVLQGLHDSQPGEVLLVNTMNSTRAVAGGLFVTEAHRRGLAGIIVDGPVRDLVDMQMATSTARSKTSNSSRNNSAGSMSNMNPYDSNSHHTANYDNGNVFPCYATSITPYSGTVSALGKSQIPIICGNVMVNPGDLVIGDDESIH